MGMPLMPDAPSTARRQWTLLGVILTLLGLLGHLLAARAIGGTHLAYRDHIFGFVFIGVVTGAIIFGLGWRFWRGRYDISLLVFGAVQALMGLFVYVERFHVHDFTG
jgi:hypothetical protein